MHSGSFFARASVATTSKLWDGWRRSFPTPGSASASSQNWKVSGAAALSLALAIGACTGAFRLIDAVLLRPLPVAHPEQLHYLDWTFVDQSGIPRDVDSFSYPLFRRMRDAARAEAQLFAISYATRQDLTYGGDTEMEKAYRQYVSGTAFSALGLTPALGRLLSPPTIKSPAPIQSRFSLTTIGVPASAATRK